ncbi:MAG: hypothetical protein JNM17_22290 [Archangium sp.]|nr:hypothetical protein [Archangium sp.]
MRRRSGLPRFFVVLMVLAGLVFLGPPALAVLAGLVGLTIGLLAIAVKVGVIALGVYAAVLLLKALFGSDDPPRRLAPSMPVPAESPADLFDDLERRKDAELAALDRELARTLAAQQVK